MSARESIIPVFVPHLGCPNDCVFCNQRRISGHVLPASPQTVRDAIENSAAFLPKGGKTQLAFYGGSFTAIPESLQISLLETAGEYLKRGDISSLRLSTRPDAIDERVLDRLESYGVETIELGAQSMDDEVLMLSGRGHSAEDVEKASRLIKQRGFKLILQMMTGLPGDTKEKSIKSAEKIIALKPDGVRIYPTVIVRDTALFDMWQAGSYPEHSVEDAVEYCAALLPMFDRAGIPVIRLGLNPTEDLSGGDAAAGAYHPALGELVKSRIMLRKAEALLENVEPGCTVTLEVGRGRTSQMLGQHRRNASKLMEKFSLKGIKVKENPALGGEIRIISLEKPGEI